MKRVATTEEFTQIVRALNGVNTAGQTRAAIGAALVALSPAYKLLDRLPDDRARAGKGELDTARTALEGWYRSIEKVAGAAPFKNDFRAKRKLIERAYIVVGGIEGEAGHVPQTSNLAILSKSISEAPQVFGKAVAEVANTAGNVAGSAVGGVLGGLGLSGTVTLLVVGAVVLLVFTKGTILGRVLKMLGGGA